MVAGHLAEALTSFGVLDGVYLFTVYAIGSYFLVDTPINVVILAIYVHLFQSESPARRNFAVTVSAASMVALTVSGLLILALDRVSPESFRIRLFHQFSSRYALLAILPYLIAHVRAPLQGWPRGFRIVARAGWLALKISFWIGAFVSLLTIRGKLLVHHDTLLLVALVLVAVHVVQARKRCRADRERSVVAAPFPVLPLLADRARLATIVTLGTAAVAIPYFWPNDPSAIYFRDRRALAASPATSLDPSPATLEDARFFPAPFLAHSNTCGTPECHWSVYKEWAASPHREAVSEAYERGAIEVAASDGPDAVRLCAGCHDPISLYSGQIAYGAGLITPEGRREGISCIVCHSVVASGGSSANGDLSFRFPLYYHQGAKGLPEYVGLWREHRLDFARDDPAPQQTCGACHSFRATDVRNASPVSLRWLGAAVHDQARMKDPCRRGGPCLECHMPRLSEPEKPRTFGARTHTFVRPFLERLATPEQTDTSNVPRSPGCEPMGSGAAR